MLALPASARVATWLNAWLQSRASADAVIAGVLGTHVNVVFDGLAPERLTPALLLGALRRTGVSQVTVALPAPGDPVGLAGPVHFNVDAHEAGEAVVLRGAGLGLVPHVVGAATLWHAHPADPPAYLPDVAGADRELRHALRGAADELARLDVAAWGPEIADDLLDLRAPVSYEGEATFASAEAARTAAAALRASTIVSMATRDEGGALSASEASARRDALVPLGRAARRAIVAACSSLDGR
ncbi:MAG: hypothetical protein H0T17_00385 [Propionibacteriales bacterium]|nr:hypothetical protein [Propionibacteriales bacterium]